LVPALYRGRKGGPSPPREEFPSLQTSIPPFLILISPILPPTQKNIWIYILHILVMKKHQIKSHWYYIFWGAATLSVLIGQLHVGSGYNRLANIMEHQAISKCND
jgi:hypothetical protein